MSLAKSRQVIQSAISRQSQKSNYDVSTKKSPFKKLDQLFLPYQLEWIYDDTDFAVAEKCRQSGFSTSQAFRSVMLALNGIKSTSYSTYSLPATKNFIRRCGNMARALNYGYKHITGKEIINEQMITTHKITFPNGFDIEAIAGNPTNLRDKPGRELVIDEAAFRLGGLGEIIKAGRANLLWGVGSIRLVSTHNGEDNDFNKECRRIESNNQLGSLHKITFREAVRQGLYKQICAIKGIEWTLENEIDWVESWYTKYGEGASEELDVVPRKFGTAKFFKPEHFHRVRVDRETLMYSQRFRAWDLAATDKSKAKTGTYYTANLLALYTGDQIIIIDGDAQQLGATEGDQWIKQTALSDTRDTVTLLEQEPGSTGIKYIQYIERLIPERVIAAYAPNEDKNVRAMPLSSALRNHQIVFDEAMDDDKFNRIRDAICGFDGKPRPLISDITDCLSMLYAYLLSEFTDHSWLED